MPHKLFYPASFLPHKNHHLLLKPDLTNFLLQNEIQVLITIERHSLWAHDNNALIFLGRVEHETCMTILRQTDAMLFLSEYESLGLPLIEAANAGKPVVCFDLPYSRELLGASPYYIKPGLHESRSICGALSQFLADQPKPRSSLLVRDAIPTSLVWNHFISSI